MKESKDANVVIYQSGGNASANARTSRVTIPGRWLKEIGVTAEEKGIHMEFDGTKITIEKL